MKIPFGITPKEVVTHAFVLILGSGIAWIVGYPLGLKNGLENGEAIATKVATRISTDAATKTRDLITTEFIKEEVDRAYKTELEAREQVGFEKARKSGEYFCALEDYYKIIRGYIAQGGAPRSAEDAVRIARNIARVKSIGADSLGEIAGKVLDGRIDELTGALQRNDANRVFQLLTEINDSLPARDISFQHAKENLATAK